MQSIKEFSTSGMDLWERKDLLKKVEPIPIGEQVYKSGGAWSCTEIVLVTKENQEEVTMFWNALYFDNKKDAEERTGIAHANYGNYLSRASKLGRWI